MIERLNRNFAGETVGYETKHNGRVYWTQQAPLLESIGQAIIVTLDITERKQAEESLKESEQRYRTLFESIDEGFCIIEKMENKPGEKLDFLYMEANPAFAIQAGVSGVVGKTIRQAFPGEPEEWFETYDNILRTGEPMKFERGLVTQGRVLELYAFRVEDGTNRRVAVVFNDITKRKQAEEALRESEQRYRNLFNLVPVAVYTCDANGLIQEYNQRAVELWGREPEKNNSKDRFCGSFKIYYPDGRFMPHEKCPMARMLNGETLEPHELEILVERQDGVRRNIIAHPLPIKNERGEIVEAINCLYDITERKQAEEALQQLNLQLESLVLSRTAKLRAVNQSLRDEISERKRVEQALHESRQRLQVLSQRLVEVQEEERRAIARELHDRVGQTLSALNINLIIVRDQLTPDSIERVGPRLDDSMHLVGETITLVRDVMSNLRPAVLDDYGLEAALQSHVDEFTTRYGIKVLLERSAQPVPRLGPSIEMTFLRIAQEALINIARHAHASQVTLTLRQEDDSIQMAVQDNGSGIESWQEANRPGSHGLTIMRERAEAFGGNLQVASVLGKGTKIEVTIPVENGGETQVQKETMQ